MSDLHKLAITLITGVGNQLARALVEYFGTPERVFSASFHQLVQVPNIGEERALQIVNSKALKRAEIVLKELVCAQATLLFFQDPGFPERLRHCRDAPVLLFYTGTADLNSRRVISVVGTRNATEYGRSVCKQLIESLEAYQVIIVSGLAYGIDVCVHTECLKANIPTVGVLGHGLDLMYPKMHQAIASKMKLHGGLLTEFLCGASPDRENFPKRNRIIAGMADAVVVIEATRKGGALITAEIANSYNRDVFAFPGRVNDPFSEGCNFLIKTNRAALLQNGKDLPYYLGWDAISKPSPATQISMPFGLDLHQQQIFQALINGSQSVDALGALTGLPQSKLVVGLFSLEIAGLVRCTPGNIYSLVQ